MCAKKTPTTPTKQNALTGITKSPVKKAPASKQTTKAKADDSTAKSNLPSAIAKDVKINCDAKKPELKSTATSNKKASKAVASETKASAPAVKQLLNVKEPKKTGSRDNSAENVKGKKQPINGKTNKVKANDSDRDKLVENKSSHIRDNKLSVTEVKSKSNSTNEQCNKFDKSSSSLSLKSNGESDNVIKDKEKLCKKGSDKAKSNNSPQSTPKKANNRNNDEGIKKSADKPKSSKIAKKANKEKESKIKISNELKNLGIEMSKSNSSLAVVIQEGLTSGVKTSICEMVKTKARYCSNLNSGGGKSQSAQAKKSSEIKMQSNKTNKESQEKVLKDGEAKMKATSESVENKKANCEQIKLVETDKSDDKKVVEDPSKNAPGDVDAKVVVKPKNKISALVNAKNSNKNKLLNEAKKCEIVNKSNDSDGSKSVKRKYAKKKPGDVTDSSKNNATASESAARNSDKIDQNKSNCVNVADVKSTEIKSASKADMKIDLIGESAAVGKKDKIETSSAAKPCDVPPNKSNTVSKAKSQLPDGSKVKKTVKSSGEKSIEKLTEMKLDIPSVAAKIKRKYVKKVKSDAGEKLTKPQKDAEKPNTIKVERDRSSDTSEAKKASNETNKNGLVEKKLKTAPTPAKEDVKKSPEKSSKPTTPKKDPLKPEEEVKVVKSKTLKSKAGDKKTNEIPSKLSPKKQKIEIKQEESSLEVSSCESENSSNSSDSDSEQTEDTFKKPNRPPIQRNLRNKKHKPVAFKRSRVASLNAIAKVHCLYENEARSAMETNIAKAVKKSYNDGSADDEDGDGDENDHERKIIEIVLKR